MIGLLGLSLILSVATYAILRYLGIRKPALWAMVVFAITFVAPMIYIMTIGDRPPPGSRVIREEELQRK